MRNEPAIDAPTDLYIDGKFRPSSDGGRFKVYDPASEEVIAEVADGTTEDAIAAVDAAAKAFDGWGAEIASIAADESFWDLDGPVVRITTPHIPLPAADNLEDMALPTVPRIVETIRRSLKA